MKSTIISEIKVIKQKVMYLLKQYPHLRDDDLKLISTIWFHEAGKNDTNDMSAFTFLQNFSNGKYTHSESIRRIRAKIQEDHPELRGKSYKERKQEGKSFKKEILDV